jgi:CheY-like chemotaxis protein
LIERARVLVADDDSGLRQSVAEILRGCGYSVAEAEDGLDAFEALSANRVDAVVLDMKMPGKDGVAVIADLDPEPPPPGVLLVSAYDIDSETRGRLGGRVCKVLRKPVPPPVLIEAVAEAIQIARGGRAVPSA